MSKLYSFPIKFIMFIFLTFAAIIITQQTVEAESSGFSVEPIFTDQIDDVPYFHLNIKEDEVKKLKVVLKNHQKEEISIQVNAANGFSNPFGEMNYTNSADTEFSSFLDEEYKMLKIIDAPKEIKLGSYEQKVVEFSVMLPDGMKKGQVLGGVQFQSYVQEDVQGGGNKDNQASFSLKIKHRYTVGVLLELEKKSESKIKLRGTEVSSDTDIPQVITQVDNENPVITKDIIFKYSVYKKGDNKPLFEGKEDLRSFAPVTSMKVPVDWAYKNFRPGDYEIKIELYDKKTKKVLDKGTNEFEIQSEKVVEYAKRSGEGNGVVPDPILLGKWVYIVVAILLVALFYLGYRYGQRKMKNKEVNEDEIDELIKMNDKLEEKKEDK